MSSKRIKFHLFFLYLFVIVSLLLNIYLISQLLTLQRRARALAQEFRPIVAENLSQAIAELEEIQNSTFEFVVEIEQEFPVNVEVPIDENVEIPVKLSFPVKQQVETTAMMALFDGDVEIPVDISVPVEVEVPIDVVVPVEVKRTIPISTTVPVDFDIPIAIDVNETPLAPYIEQLRVALIMYQESADQLLQEVEQ